ncbi:MAG: ACP phosphodiesterase [Gammaproteobacteria bacterium]|nr:ACP phosphodiesterase [Gammaproteobacteria bacterium]
MNFLAHFHLAWPDEGLVAGGLEGDYYKGPLRNDIHADIARGVQLHRAIDAYTDAHPALLRLRRQMPPPLRRFAGILIDLSFDHFLCVHWSQFSQERADSFNRDVYAILQRRQYHISDGARQMMQRIIDHDLLALYRQWHTVGRSAQRIGERFQRDNPFNDIETALAPLQTSIEQAFLEFYPDLQVFSERKRQTLL